MWYKKVKNGYSSINTIIIIVSVYVFEVILYEFIYV